MNDARNEHLQSIRRGVWAIFAVLLLIFGYDHVPVGRSDFGATIALIGLVTGIILLVALLVGIARRVVTRLNEMADDEKSP